MRHALRRRGADGQGAVEYIGVVLVLAVMAAVTAIIVARIRPPDHPPRVPVERISQRIELPLILGSRDDRPGPGRLRRMLRAAPRAIRTGSGIVRDGAIAFGAGFGSAARSDLEGLLTDPVGALRGTGAGLGAVLRDPIGTARDRAADAAAYVRMLRTMPAREAYLRAMRDLGVVAEDLAVSRGKRLVAKRVGRAATRRGGRRPEPVEAASAGEG